MKVIAILVVCILQPVICASAEDIVILLDDPAFVSSLGEVGVLCIIYGDEPTPAAASKAKGILSQLDRVKSGDSSSEMMELYIAYCSYYAGNKERATKLAEEIVKRNDPSSAPEADVLLARMQGMAKEEDIEQVYSTCAKYYPYGHDADSLLLSVANKGKHAEDIASFDRGVVQRNLPLGMAAEGFTKMGMWQEAIEAWRMCVGAERSAKWLRMDGLWEKIAECHEHLGNWDEAAKYYVKAIASGGDRYRLSASAKRAFIASREHKKVEVPKSSPSAKELEQIARWYCEGMYFAPAVAAAQMARKYDAGSVVLGDVYADYAKTIAGVLNRYGKDVIFRGDKLNEERVQQLQALAEESVHKIPTTRKSGDTIQVNK